MNKPVTYSLTGSNKHSNSYYHDVRAFTDEVLQAASYSLLPAVREYKDYLKKFGLEDIRSDEEYILELLSFGILWRMYGGYAMSVRVAPFISMAHLAEWRKKHQRLKPSIDVARGVLMTLFLLPKKGDRKMKNVVPTRDDVDRLCKWLAATGEFGEQALRFVRWRAYWEGMSSERWIAGCKTLFHFVDWFAERSLAALGKYTANVERFLHHAPRKYRWREDRIQCGRTRLEYHLNMTGAEMMNRAFRGEFLSTDTKALLVPGCMRSKPDDECESVPVPGGKRCTGCLASCEVNRLREMGKKKGFETFIIPHASDLSLWSLKPGQPRRGMVAAACVTTLVEGGWELKRYDVSAQCVLLDFSGCRKHWHPKGVPTAINLTELKRILSEQSASLSN